MTAREPWFPAPGDRVRVLDEYDIPALLRGGKPSEGVVERTDDATAIVIVDGKAVPYAFVEIEPAESANSQKEPSDA